MGTLHKPSIWFGLTIVMLLAVFLYYHRQEVPPLRVGKVWLEQAEDGFYVKFQLVGPYGDTIPGKGFLELRFYQMLYPVGNEIGATLEQHFNIQTSDFAKETVGSGEQQRYIYTAVVPKITYQCFSPPAQSGITCKMALTFTDSTYIGNPRTFHLEKDVVI